MKHHLIKEKTWHVVVNGKDAELRCVYCNSKIEKLDSSHDWHAHYKETKCGVCGKKVFAKMRFGGTNHHDLMKSELEKKLKEDAA